VVLSLLGIGGGFVVLYGLLSSQRFEAWTKLFLATTVATTVTGFLFPFHGVQPAHVVGIVSLIALTIAVLARYRFHLAGSWRRGYVITATMALYLNVFVLIVQLFQKVPALRALAPTQTESPFQIVQLTILVIFVALTFRAAIGFEKTRRAA
jgi:hypothetical protein